MTPTYDLVIIGAGLAGLTLARHIQLENPQCRVLHLEKNPTTPGPRQKVGESTVQIQGHYLAKVLDLETHLFHDHFMKYNLRFHWPKSGMTGQDYFELDQSFIRHFSNIPSFQMDRNRLEAHLVNCNRKSPNYTLYEGISKLDIQLGKDQSDHQVHFHHKGERQTVATRWLVDSSGRNRRLAKHLETRQKLPIAHSASYFWIDGSIDVSKLTKADPKIQRMHPTRREMGHLPYWLATNHFMGEGFWFWVIALRNRTSFGLVYDRDCVDPKQVKSFEGLKSWLYERYPIFQTAFEDKEAIDFTVIHNFGHDCRRTIDAQRWALTGEAGRFSDPLYSPGGDLMAIHNTLIVDAIKETDPTKLKAKVANFEVVFQALFKSFLKSYDPGYKVLGDQESFSIKYTWELAVYFGFFVFPFINEKLTDRNFLIPWLRRLSMIAPFNHKVLNTVHAFCQWKKTQPPAGNNHCAFDFTQVQALQACAETFFEIGLENKQAIQVLNRLLEQLEKAARYFITYMSARMLGRPELLRDASFIQAIDFEEVEHCPETLAKTPKTKDSNFQWGFCPKLLGDVFWNYEDVVYENP